MNPEVAGIVPKLSPKVRLRWDNVRNRPMLLYPEGVLLLNLTGYRILQLCNGQRALADILAELQKEFPPSDTMKRDVLEFLERLRQKRFILWEQGEHAEKAESP